MMAIEHKEADRVPMDIGGEIIGPVEATYQKLADFLGVRVEEPRCALYGPVMNFDLELLRRLDVDIIHIYRRGPRPRSTSEGYLIDCWGIVHRKLDPVGYQPWIHPLKTARTIGDVEEYEWPDPRDPAFVGGIEEEARYLHRETEYAVCMGGEDIGSLFNTYAQLVGYERAFADIYRNRELMERVCDILMEFQLDLVDRLYGLIGDHVDIAIVSEDLGTQQGPYMSLDLWRKLFKPRFEKIVKRIKEHTKAKILMHSDGSIAQFLSDIADLGVDIINPIQPKPPGMEPSYLKQSYGQKLCFHGGIDVQELLPFGTRSKVESEVKKTISTLGPGGGYILASSHVIGKDVPPENIVAMYDAGRSCRYPIRIREGMS